MWKAVSKSSGDVFYMLPEKAKYTVGRQSSDLNIKDDSSISRNHAYLKPSLDYIEVVDVGSKFNTYCNENIENKIPMEKNQGYKLKDGERIKFGQMHSEYILTKMKIVTVPSTLNGSERQALTNIMNIIKGQIEDEVTPKCTHLTMNGITVTIKLLHALLEGISIVNLNFWKDYLESLRDGKSLPDPLKYIPDVAENFMNIKKEMLTFKEERKALFRDKTFMFMNKKVYDVYTPIILKAGGQSKVLKNVPFSQLIQKNIIVVQNTSSTQSQETDDLMDKISEFLKKHSLRLIPEYEIGIALINCSVQKYCNTQYNIENVFFNKNNVNSFNSGINDIIAEDTPNSDMRNKKIHSHLPEIEVPESVGSAVYDVLDSDAEESEKVNSQNIEPDSEGNHFNMIIEEEDDSGKQKVKENGKNTEDPQNKRKRVESPTSNLEQNKRINLEGGNMAKASISIAKPKIIYSGFLDKSIIRKNAEISKENDIASQNSPESSNIQKKRGRFANLDSGDENDNGDLFDMGRSSKKSRISVSSDDDDDRNNNSESELFNVRKRTNQTLQTSSQTNASSSNNADTSKTSNPFTLRKDTKQSYTREWKKPNLPEEPISTVGWLSKQMIKIKIKDEVEDKEETTGTTDTDTDKDKDKGNESEEVTIKLENDTKWIDSLNGGFQVRVRNMELVSRSSVSNISDSNDDSATTSNTANGKNFKAFVKKQNFKPQKEILTTVPYHVTGFSF